jgi:hypothetical protein
MAKLKVSAISRTRFDFIDFSSVENLKHATSRPPKRGSNG